MKHSIHQQETQQLKRDRNRAYVFVLGLLVSNLLLVLLLGVSSLYQKTRYIPPGNTQALVLSDMGASDNYFSRLAIYLATLRFNVTSDNVDTMHRMFLRYVSTDAYPVLKEQLLNESKHIRHASITISFFPNQVKVGDHGKEVLISGMLASTVSNSHPHTVPVNYLLKFHYAFGLAQLTSFKEVSVHD